jgi:hypothetical protein
VVDALPTRQKKRKLDNRDGTQGYVRSLRTLAGYALSPPTHTVKRCQGVAPGLHLDGKLIHARIHLLPHANLFRLSPLVMNYSTGFVLLQRYVPFPFFHFGYRKQKEEGQAINRDTLSVLYQDG